MLLLVYLNFYFLELCVASSFMLTSAWLITIIEFNWTDFDVSKRHEAFSLLFWKLISCILTVPDYMVSCVTHFDGSDPPAESSSELIDLRDGRRFWTLSLE